MKKNEKQDTAAWVVRSTAVVDSHLKDLHKVIPETCPFPAPVFLCFLKKSFHSKENSPPVSMSCNLCRHGCPSESGTEKLNLFSLFCCC